MAIEGYNSENSQILNTDNTTNLANNSGEGSASPVLDIVAKKFNWGAFLLNWVWGLGNRSFITLIIFPVSYILGLIPYVGWLFGLGCCIWFGIKGNEWAWQNKRWESIEHFHSVQKKWAIGGIIFFVSIVLLLILLIFAIFIPLMMTSN